MNFLRVNDNLIINLQQIVAIKILDALNIV